MSRFITEALPVVLQVINNDHRSLPVVLQVNVCNNNNDHRSMFVPYPGAVLVAADYSQLELRLIAQLSKDKNLR